MLSEAGSALTPVLQITAAREEVGRNAVGVLLLVHGHPLSIETNVIHATYVTQSCIQANLN